jgi:hypothetical protein
VKSSEHMILEFRSELPQRPIVSITDAHSDINMALFFLTAEFHRVHAEFSGVF